MRLSSICVVLLLATGCATTSLSEEERSALDAVHAFFDVIASHDAEAGARLTLPEGVFVNVRVEDDRQVVKHFSNAEWLAKQPSETRRLHEAFDGTPTVLVDGDAAVVWGRYVFDVDGERSHRGVDAFNLIRTDEGWKIAGGVYTVVR